jgi:hypothetical protein
MAMPETYPHIHKDTPRLLFDFSRRIRYTDEADMIVVWYPQGVPGAGPRFIVGRSASGSRAKIEPMCYNPP